MLTQIAKVIRLLGLRRAARMKKHHEQGLGYIRGYAATSCWWTLLNSGFLDELDRYGRVVLSDYVAAHGTGTPLNDVSETAAIKTVFGKGAYRVPISSSKSSVGHMLGAAGAFSIMVLIKTLQDNVIHPTANLETPDPECDLDYVPGEPREVPVNIAIANAFGFGGQNASAVLTRFNG